ncbi:MAG: hypothetical protein KAS66_09975 [Candidatus Omnitrophica bacterium]|nr:hypothetical protein [Candidatus Omnitrophota bacterium]
MNTKSLFFTSFLIALLCHWFIFNFFTFIFSIDPGSFKPKFFFLGPILQQSDVNQSSPGADTGKKGPVASNHFDHDRPVLKNIYYEISDPEKKPFTIKTIRKPLAPQTTEEQEKLLIKSTFQSTIEEVKTEGPDKKLSIRPYQPLRSRLP